MRADLLAGQDAVRRPGVVGVERHELDEAHLVGLAPGKLGEREHLVLGEAAHRDAVDLDRAELRDSARAPRARRSTCGSESRRVIWKKRSRESESSETLMRRSPAAARSPAIALEQVAVGRQREVVARRRCRPASRPASGSSRRTSGSPPVSRTSVDAHRGEQPRPGARSPRSVRISLRSSQGSPSAGMQYWQRKLQRSVTDTRRSEIGRPWPSRSGSRAGHAAASPAV